MNLKYILTLKIYITFRNLLHQLERGKGEKRRLYESYLNEITIEIKNRSCSVFFKKRTRMKMVLNTTPEILLYTVAPLIPEKMIIRCEKLTYDSYSLSNKIK